MQGIIPDSSVPITTGTVTDLGTPSTVPSLGTSGAPLTFPHSDYKSMDELKPTYTPEEYNMSEVVWGGMMQTAWAAAMMANDIPSFPSNPSYNAEAELDDLEKGLGYQISLDDREHLLRSRSTGEFFYRKFQIDEKAQGARAMASSPILGMVGASAEVDVLLGYGIGAVSRAASLGRAATMTNLTVGTAAGTAGTYAYAYGDAPFSVKDAAIHVGIASSLAFLYGTGFKYKPRKGMASKPTAEGAPSGAPSGATDDAVGGTTGEGTTTAGETNPTPDMPTEPLQAATPPIVDDIEPPPLVINKGKSANKRVVDSPETATDDDILNAIDDSDEDFWRLE